MYAVLYALLFEILLDPGSTNQCILNFLVSNDSVNRPNISIILGDHVVGKKMIIKVTSPGDAMVNFCSTYLKLSSNPNIF